MFKFHMNNTEGLNTVVRYKSIKPYKLPELGYNGKPIRKTTTPISRPMLSTIPITVPLEKTHSIEMLRSLQMKRMQPLSLKNMTRMEPKEGGTPPRCTREEYCQSETQTCEK